jgi:hypothetical protein
MRLVGLDWVADRRTDVASAIIPAAGDMRLAPYFGTPIARFASHGAEALATDAEGNPVLTAFSLGKGTVVYAPDATAEGARRALEVFVDRTSAPRAPLSPILPNRPMFELERADGGRVYTLFATKPDRPGLPSNGPWIDAPETYSLRVGDHQIDQPLGAYGVSLVAVRTDGSIDALEGQGEFRDGGSILMSSEPHVMAMSLDQRPLRESAAVAMFPIRAGSISLQTSEGVDTVEAGEVANGQFHVLERIPAQKVDGRLSFRIDDVQSQCLLLISSAAGPRQAHQMMNAAVK